MKSKFNSVKGPCFATDTDNAVNTKDESDIVNNTKGRFS